MDHAGLLEVHMFVIVVKAKTKALEVAQVTSTSSSAIKRLL